MNQEKQFLYLGWLWPTVQKITTRLTAKYLLRCLKSKHRIKWITITCLTPDKIIASDRFWCVIIANTVYMAICSDDSQSQCPLLVLLHLLLLISSLNRKSSLLNSRDFMGCISVTRPSSSSYLLHEKVSPNVSWSSQYQLLVIIFLCLHFL